MAGPSVDSAEDDNVIASINVALGLYAVALPSTKPLLPPFTDSAHPGEGEPGGRARAGNEYDFEIVLEGGRSPSTSRDRAR